MKKSEVFTMNPDLTQRLEGIRNGQSWLEWNKAKSFHPEIKIDYVDYRKMVEAFGQIAMVLDRTNNKNELPVIEEVPTASLVPIQDQDLITLENDVEVFDGFLESDQAFAELADSLGLN